MRPIQPSFSAWHASHPVKVRHDGILSKKLAEAKGRSHIPMGSSSFVFAV